MGGLLVTYLFIGGFVWYGSHLMCLTIRSCGFPIPQWFSVILAGCIFLAFVLSPLESQGLVDVFRAQRH
jgi:hypothetical protein